jgi:hypothetical protein
MFLKGARNFPKKPGSSIGKGGKHCDINHFLQRRTRLVVERSSTMSVRSKIMLTIEKVAREHNRPLAPLTDDLVLLESGLDSLSLAVIVVRLEDQLMVDPFTNSNPVDFPVTLGDLVTAYELAVESAASVKRAEKPHGNTGPLR